MWMGLMFDIQCPKCQDAERICGCCRVMNWHCRCGYLMWRRGGGVFYGLGQSMIPDEDKEAVVDNNCGILKYS